MFTDVYNKLRSAGTQFPALPERGGAAIQPLIPQQQNGSSHLRPPSPHQRNASFSSTSSSPRQQSKPIQVKPEWSNYTTVTDDYKQKVNKDIEQVMNYLNLLKDMLVTSDQAEIQKSDAVTQLVAVVRAIKTRMAHLIASIDDEQLLVLTIDTHTQIHEVLQYYEHKLKGDASASIPDLHDPQAASQQMITTGAASSILDLGVFDRQHQLQLPAASSSSSTSSATASSSRNDMVLYDTQQQQGNAPPAVNPFHAFDSSEDASQQQPAAVVVHQPDAFNTYNDAAPPSYSFDDEKFDTEPPQQQRVAAPSTKAVAGNGTAAHSGNSGSTAAAAPVSSFDDLSIDDFDNNDVKTQKTSSKQKAGSRGAFDELNPFETS